MSKQVKYTVIDAFTRTAFKGNPAAVIVQHETQSNNLLPEEHLQLVAREFNLSETAFVTLRSAQAGPDEHDSDVSHFNPKLRWFMPKEEVALCGHATLASAFVLFNMESAPQKTKSITFETISGNLTAELLDNGLVELDLPACEPQPADVAWKERGTAAVKDALNHDVEVLFVGVGQGISFKMYMFIELPQSLNLEAAEINPGSFLTLAPNYAVIILTNRPTSEVSGTVFVSRVFDPSSGVPEDPVTGSAHCMLAPYWMKRLGLQEGAAMAAKQVSERGGDVQVVWDEARARCKVRGNAAIVAQGILHMPDS